MSKYVTEEMRNRTYFMMGVMLILIGLLIMVKPVFEKNGLEYIYELSEDSLLEHLDEVIVSMSSTETLEDKISSSFYAMTGCIKVSQEIICLDKDQMFKFEEKGVFGEIKLVAISDSGAIKVLENEKMDCFVLTAGCYEFYCLGNHYVGKIQLYPSEEDIYEI